MTLVGVEDLRRRDARERRVRLDRARAADAEQQLLQQSVLAAAAVEAIGDAAELLDVLLHIRVQQQQRDAPDREAPDAGVQRAALGEREHDLRGGSVRVPQHAHGQAVRIEHRIALLLPAVARDRLAEVAGAVEQSDADDRDAEVGGALQVVAREDAESARVLRQCRGDPELR